MNVGREVVSVSLSGTGGLFLCRVGQGFTGVLATTAVFAALGEQCAQLSRPAQTDAASGLALGHAFTQEVTRFGGAHLVIENVRRAAVRGAELTCEVKLRHVEIQGHFIHANSYAVEGGVAKPDAG